MVPLSQFDGSTPPPEGISYFDLFGIKPSLLPDPEQLRATFYELSRKFHPDQSKALYAARWSSLVNRAYQTLKNREETALYLLGGELKGNKIPTELAETYFELQDALGEPEGHQKLLEFKAELQKQLAQSGEEWGALEKHWKETKDNSLIEKQLTRERYLKSMLADIEKKL